MSFRPCAFGRIDPLSTLSKLTTLYKCLADSAAPSGKKRAENAILCMVELRIGPEFLNRLPLDLLFGEGYKSVKDFIDPSRPRSTIGDIATKAKTAGSGEVQAVLVMRVLAKALIMWNAVAHRRPTGRRRRLLRPSGEAVDARTKHGRPMDDALELAYYNILAASRFVIDLKSAGTARQEAYMTDYTAFDHKIRRSAVHDGLNLISISLSMVMAGTGEILCLRRLRIPYHQTMYHPVFKCSIHVATHMSLELLILGGGRFTLLGQSHLTLFRYRMIAPELAILPHPSTGLVIRSRLLQQDIRPAIHTVSGALYTLDKQLDVVRTKPEFLAALRLYARGEPVLVDERMSPNISQHLAWYMLRNSVPVSTLLLVLKDLANEAYTQCLGQPLPDGTDDTATLEQGIKEVLHAIGMKLTTGAGIGLDNGNTRQDATLKLETASRENYPEYMLMLSSVLVDENPPIHVRNAAGLALKNTLTARHQAKTKIKNDAFLTLGSSSQKAGTFASQVVAAIAAVELPINQWGDLIEILLGFVNTQTNTNLRIATPQTIGCICESIKPEILTLCANEILTTVIHGARKEETSQEVQLSAIHALYNSLKFVRDNFEREGERNYIMQVVCEATQNPSVAVQVGAFECLVRITGLYYDKMGFYMEQALFGLTVVGMKHPDERVALQAVELWSTVCEEEAQEDRPVLLLLSTKQEELAEEDEWNVSMAAGTCLSFAGAVQDVIVPTVIPFIKAHIKSTDWHHREAAVMTFGSILEGPDPIGLTPLTAQALPLLIDMMSDTNADVKDTVAWTLGRLCNLLIQTIKPDLHLHALLGSFDSEQDLPVQTGPLSPYTEGVVQALLRVTESAGNEHNFRTATYKAVLAYLSGATLDAIPMVQNTVIAILNRMEQLLGMQNQILGVDDRNDWNELQSNFCSVVMSVIRKLNAGIQPPADRIMTLVLQLIQVAGVPAIPVPCHKGTKTPNFAVSIIGDISRTLGPKAALYANKFMTVLKNLQSEVLNRNFKISILSGFGNIATAIGPSFELFLDDTMSVLQQEDALQPNPLDYDLMDYVRQLQEWILKAYTGLVGGLKGTGKVSVLVPYIESILELIQRCSVDEERTDTQMKLSCGFLGDLAEALQGSP
ncbi:Importin N-terminal domain-containing protein [Mycena venus]|uniref:Importin N-terminal domain-containing protein n=1 Tax=Mycena venus TaxID=2733690 RepID=A0A8H6YJ26_9AGAR|nr:Importin N-terminal domain-containing protein [Mycena venus]